MAPTLIEQKARTLARLLSGHGLTVPHDQLVGLIEERRDTLAAAMHIQPTSALRYLDDDAWPTSPPRWSRPSGRPATSPGPWAKRRTRR